MEINQLNIIYLCLQFIEYYEYRNSSMCLCILHCIICNVCNVSVQNHYMAVQVLSLKILMNPKCTNNIPECLMNFVCTPIPT